MLSRGGYEYLKNKLMEEKKKKQLEGAGGRVKGTSLIWGVGGDCGFVASMFGSFMGFFFFLFFHMGLFLNYFKK